MTLAEYNSRYRLTEEVLVSLKSFGITCEHIPEGKAQRFIMQASVVAGHKKRHQQRRTQEADVTEGRL